MQQQFQGLQQSLQSMTPDDMRMMKEMLSDLNSMLDEKARGGECCRREVGHDEVRLPFLPERSPCAKERGELACVGVAAAEKDFRIAVGTRAQHAFGCRPRGLEDIEVACLGKERQLVQLAEAERDVMSALGKRVREGGARERMPV